MSLPQTRTLTDADGFRWYVTVDRGRLVITRDGVAPVVFERPEELRSLAPQLVRAVVEHDLDVQHAAAKASADRRQRRRLAGEPVGIRHRPFVDPAEPAMNLDELIA